jgi:hypothetical protein
VSPGGTVMGPGPITVSSENDIIQVGFTSSKLPPAPQPVTPTLDCVSPIGNGQYRAHFGYRNPNTSPTAVAIGPDNRFSQATRTAGSRRSSRPVSTALSR